MAFGRELALDGVGVCGGGARGREGEGEMMLRRRRTKEEEGAGGDIEVSKGISKC